jgi:ABC-type sugar transport system permease subunit
MIRNAKKGVNIKKRNISVRLRSRIIFYSLMMALPLLQWLVFYVGLNANTFVMAFEKWSFKTDGGLGYNVVFAGLDNFKVAFQFFCDTAYMLKNSLIVAFCNTLIGLTFALVFSFYIYKKFMLSGTFKTFLFMPQIISGLIFSLLFKYIANDVFVAVFGEGQSGFMGLLDRDSETKFNVILIYHVFLSFGVRVLLFSGAMSGIDESLVESAKLDGANLVQEFVYITLPLIYPTIVSLVVIGLSSVVTDQMHLFSMFGNDAKEIGTLGYYLYLLSQQGSEVSQHGYYSYAELSAISIVCTVVMVPIILGTKRLMKTFGPAVD